MIVKTFRTTKFSPVIKRVLRDGDIIPIYKQDLGVSNDPAMIAGSMQNVASASRSEKPVYHLIVSWDSSDSVNTSEMVQVAQQLLNNLGLSEHQSVVAEHYHFNRPYIHMVVNAVHRRHGELADVRVQAPDNSEFSTRARELGGSYEEEKKEWSFPPEKRDEIDNLCKEVYGDKQKIKFQGGKPIQTWWNRDHWKIIESTLREMEREHGWREVESSPGQRRTRDRQTS